jgi:CelD/BcsL family acetyltransferase involved in cellulose biosynthesis
MLNAEIIDTYEKFLTLKNEWNDALAAGDINAPFMTFEWFSCWWRIYGKNNRMMVLIIRDNGRIAVLAPLMQARMRWRGLPVTAISFMDNYLTSRMGLALARGDDEIVNLLFSLFRERESQYDLLMLNYVEKDSYTDRAVSRMIQANRLSYVDVETDTTPFIPVQGTWEAYLKNRSKNFRKRLRNLHNQFDRAGGYEVVKYTTEDTAKALEEMFFVSRHSWKFKHKTAVVNDPEQMEFYTSLAHAFAPRGWLNIWVLKLKGEPIAYAFNVRYNQRIYGWKIGYHEGYANLSPSKFLDFHIFKDCFDHQLIEFDFMGKNEPYKLDWTKNCRYHRKYYIFNRNRYSRLLYLFETKAVRKLKQLFPGKNVLPQQVPDDVLADAVPLQAPPAPAAEIPPEPVRLSDET